MHVHYKIIQKKLVFLYQLGDQHAVSPILFQCLFVPAYLECEILKVAVISKWATLLTGRSLQRLRNLMVFYLVHIIHLEYIQRGVFSKPNELNDAHQTFIYFIVLLSCKT